jgi:hypothetical protein
MKLLLYSGLLYLAGVAAVLVLRPSLMFREDGTWKEFGIGRNSHYYTWLPFWLFAIVWAIVSYLLVLMFAGANLLPGISAVEEVVQAPQVTELANASANVRKKVVQSVDELKPGYYILNAEETARKGVPKYIYLGPEPPRLMYNATGGDTE